MRHAQIVWANTITKMMSGEEPICQCRECNADLFYDDKAFRIGGRMDILCEDCFDDYVKEEFQITIGENEIDEPDWDTLED